ncbi:hypothetical protein FGO68_gene3807 [Halteria grandinella]|uniref:Uncharacterized protein n=1 Tax=Halteria grandinella TaxID=5974 RepID=A0A8J8SWW3_HALGN|nr:hypothetical protein FGO68_gene3807 [Halteria grandinella]
MSTTFEKTVKIVDPKGKVLAELSKVLKDVTVEEFKKLLVRASPFPLIRWCCEVVKMVMCQKSQGNTFLPLLQAEKIVRPY